MKLLSWFYNLKTANKLIGAFVFVAILQICVGLFALSNMGKLNNGVNSMYTDRLQPIQNMTEVRGGFLNLRVILREMYIRKSVKERDNLIESTKTVRTEIAEYIEAYKKGDLSNGQEKLLESFAPVWDEYNKSFEESYQLIKSGKDEEYLQFMDGDWLVQANELNSIINELINLETAEAENAIKDAEDMYTVSQIIMISVIVFTFILCVAFGLFISRIIARPLSRVTDLVEKVADGDLTETADIYTKDEVGVLAQSVNTMVLNLRATVQNIQSAAENLSASSEQVSASTEEIASASSNQANAAQTMNELFRELSDAINAVAQNTEIAAELANKTIQIAQDGEKVVLSSVDGANVVSEQISRLEEDSNRIGEIIEVIDDIADQTNLLALNAAIEAARAGEQGRGFAVVADEVRKLAERSGEATKQITTIIKGMQENTALSVKSVQEGLVFTQQSGEAFENIIHMVNDTGNKVTEIAGASEEQAAQSEEVLTFIESISAATEEATASSEETASTAHTLTDLAEELNASVAAFKIN
ncbi:methyl-accepting chemotaxis protein [Siminovitchia acidinfaciens]|uniref:Methyl-accepting chemotaxis protein n=1 Tax=Siminovitchia acidinfaciens TaxID=2321395 RepID=A0A429Y205_9BACI|nr:methyl-accepting chemotaxis protein [Siminovitchia acidinfaciens]RST75273.1 methyl-accepting chemotaxis protein [Siminovitchia acidinfaciens]